MPYFRPKDYNRTEGKKPVPCKCATEKSKPNTTPDTTDDKITHLKNTILHRNQNIEFYKTLYSEYVESIQEHITPYIRNQLKHEEQGRGLRKGSVFQMHLMMNLRVRVQSTVDTIAKWQWENAVDEAKLTDMEKANGEEKEED